MERVLTRTCTFFVATQIVSDLVVSGFGKKTISVLVVNHTELYLICSQHETGPAAARRRYDAGGPSIVLIEMDPCLYHKLNNCRPAVLTTLVWVIIEVDIVPALNTERISLKQILYQY